MSGAYVVTGGGHGVGRGIVERLLETGAGVVLIDVDPVDWAHQHAASSRLACVTGDAGDVRVAEAAADRARQFGPLLGWVNNAAIFRDASLHANQPKDVLDLISLNLAPVVTGCATAVRRFRAAETGGSIVNVSTTKRKDPCEGRFRTPQLKRRSKG